MNKLNQITGNFVLHKNMFWWHIFDNQKLFVEDFICTPLICTHVCITCVFVILYTWVFLPVMIHFCTSVCFTFIFVLLFICWFYLYTFVLSEFLYFCKLVFSSVKVYFCTPVFTCVFVLLYTCVFSLCFYTSVHLLVLPAFLYTCWFYLCFCT